MKATELRTKSVKELQELLIENTRSLVETKRSLAANELPNPRVVSKTKRDIARIKTVLTEKVTVTEPSSNDTAKKGDA